MQQHLLGMTCSTVSQPSIVSLRTVTHAICPCSLCLSPSAHVHNPRTLAPSSLTTSTRHSDDMPSAALSPQCKAALDTAREQVAAMVHAHPSEVHFTSCGTESDNWAIYGAVAAWRARRGQQQQQAGGSAGSVVPHVVTTAVEHPAILVHLEHLRSQVG